MSNQIHFIKKPIVTGISPSIGFTGNSFVINGVHLHDASNVYFVDVFGNKTEVNFSKQTTPQGTQIISGTIPALDGTLGKYLVRVENSLGFDDFCCFEHYVSTQTLIRNISGDDTKQTSDRLSINSEISASPTNTQGFEVLNLTYNPVGPTNKLLVQAEISLQSSYWGSAVVALFKDSETTPKKVWNYSLLGLNFGQIAKIGYVAEANSTNQQKWRVRVGRAAGTFPIIYVNRDSSTNLPYGGAASSWMSITEIDD
tara:strand:+ start:374 stop:1141 length:768 start_codon:yes stop_codon:yes gene_type:complete